MKDAVEFLEEIFVLSLTLPGLAIDSRRKEVSSVFGMEGPSIWGGLLDPLRIFDRGLEQFQAVCSSFWVSPLLWTVFWWLLWCTADSHLCCSISEVSNVLTTEYVENESTALEFDWLWAAPRVIWWVTDSLILLLVSENLGLYFPAFSSLWEKHKVRVELIIYSLVSITLRADYCMWDLVTLLKTKMHLVCIQYSFHKTYFWGWI